MGMQQVNGAGMKITIETVENFLKSLECRYEREKMSLAGVENVEIRLFNHSTGEQAARLEFISNVLTKIDYWDQNKKTIESIKWE
ncbi:MAG: hypothetical protein C4532_07590 [Candidatus Abyssobacteria bacterium SURF_17]|jgi:hypothetical protein|uniref:Uncharacterized protein n=1 Tax=Candidatus Abyssobacteria bacterium SURF_17 TaxID=2093361 RepID=A0A419F0T3_9BACT|nr:MAG: hypothetical protein C4532_07590 [Candidatus Abyssubacteria bacterium SURF_17]